MGERLSRWGVGPRITVPMLLAALLGGMATWLWPDVCIVRAIPRYVAVPCGGVLLAVGLPLWRFAVPAVMRAYNDDRLVTTGVFGLVRNPIYSAWIVFNIPGISLVFRAWPLLLPSLVGYVCFKKLIHRENEYLEERYGEAYRAYKAEVPELFPRFWSRKTVSDSRSLSVSFSPATAKDAAAIFDLQRLAYQTEAAIYEDYTIPPLVETPEQLQNQFSIKVFWKATSRDRMVGSVRAYAKEGTCYIERLIVDPEHRRLGIGTALLQRIEAAFPGVRRFELFTGHKSVNNLRLYERLGYRPFRQQAIHERLTIVFLEKVLDSDARGGGEPAGRSERPKMEPPRTNG